MSTEPFEDLPPLNASATILREVAVLGANLGGLKDTFDDFRRETRENFDRARIRVEEIRHELQQETVEIRAEMRETFRNHANRLDSLEATRDTTKGSLSMGKVLWGGALSLAGAVAAWFGRSAT